MKRSERLFRQKVREVERLIIEKNPTAVLWIKAESDGCFTVFWDTAPFCEWIENRLEPYATSADRDAAIAETITKIRKAWPMKTEFEIHGAGVVDQVFGEIRRIDV